jgi:hypothetical protein
VLATPAPGDDSVLTLDAPTPPVPTVVPGERYPVSGFTLRRDGMAVGGITWNRYAPKALAAIKDGRVVALRFHASSQERVEHFPNWLYAASRAVRIWGEWDHHDRRSVLAAIRTSPDCPRPFRGIVFGDQELFDIAMDEMEHQKALALRHDLQSWRQELREHGVVAEGNVSHEGTYFVPDIVYC